jgi:S-adenosylhomocysteine hydrolase
MSVTKERQYDIADINLAERGRFRMQWAAKEMPVLDLIEARFKKNSHSRAFACRLPCTSLPRLPT